MGRGGVKCVFIINFLFLHFLVFMVLLEQEANLKFLNEYGELDSVEPESWAAAFDVS